VTEDGVCNRIRNNHTNFVGSESRQLDCLDQNCGSRRLQNERVVSNADFIKHRLTLFWRQIAPNPLHQSRLNRGLQFPGAAACSNGKLRRDIADNFFVLDSVSNENSVRARGACWPFTRVGSRVPVGKAICVCEPVRRTTREL